MTSTLIFGFFPLISATRHSTARKGTQQGTTTHLEYQSAIPTGTSHTPCTIRVWVLPSAQPVAPNTVALVIGKLFAPPNEPVSIDAHALYPVPGDPAADDYEDHIPGLDAPWVSIVGHASSPANMLADGVSRAFSINASEYIRGSPSAAPYQARFNGNTTRWANTPVPYLNTACHAYGQVVGSVNGMLTFDISNLALNIAPLATATANANTSSGNPSPGKKRRFQVSSASDSTGPSAHITAPAASVSSTTPAVASTSAPTSSAVHTPLVDTAADDDDSLVDDPNTALSAKARGKRRA